MSSSGERSEDATVASVEQERFMRRSLVDTVELPELPIGRLGALTVHRMTTADDLHHRAGPWARCSEDFSRVLRVGTDVRPPAALDTPDDARELNAPLTDHQRTEPAFA
jgi:hypothetical protein